MSTLGIDVSKFGKDDQWFFLNDPALFLDFHEGSGLVSIGYLESEKTFRQTMEYANFETGIPRSEVRRDVIRQSFELEGVLKQFQKETMALTMQRTVDTSDATYDRVIIGEAVPDPIFPAAVLIGQTVDGDEIRLWVRKLQITSEDLEIILGGEEYSSIPFKGTAQIDVAPATTNPTWAFNAALETQDNIAFWSWEKASSS